MRITQTLLVLSCVAALLFAAPVAAQSVRGRVLDAETGVGINSARITLLRGTSRVSETLSDTAGRFYLSATTSGEYRLEASFIGYRTSPTDVFTLGAREQLVVDIRLAREAIALEPLTIVARRNDPRHDATEEGVYARRLRLPQLGTSRVVVPVDPEMANARDARDVLTWLPPPRAAGCVAVYWKGVLVQDRDLANTWLETPTSHLEAVEYYRWQRDAPAAYHEVPLYLHWGGCPTIAVVALWPRSGRYLTEDIPVIPLPEFSWRTQVMPTFERISGTFAPEFGVGVEAATQWHVRGRLSFGAHLRGTAHQLSSSTADDMTRVVSTTGYVRPPGNRTLQLWIVGVEPRIAVVQQPRVRVTTGARLQVGHRTFTLQKTLADNPEERFSGFGGGIGGTAGVEIQLRQRLAVNAGLVQDWLWFRRYKQIDPRLTQTAGGWGITGLRLGFTYTSAH